MNKFVKIILIFLLSVVLLTGAFSGGFIAGHFTQLPALDNLPFIGGMPLQQPLATPTGASNATPDALKDIFTPFWEAWDLVHKQYVTQPVDDIKLMRGAISGLSLATRPEDIARAMLEGVAHRAARLWALVNEALPEIDTVVATGGTLLSQPWLMQLLADALDRPLVMSGSGEGSARGAAIWALARISAIDGLTGVGSPRGRVFRPRPEAHRRLAAGMQRQRLLEEAVAGLRAREAE